MFLIDNFRIVLLVVLICVSGISPAHGQIMTSCIKDTDNNPPVDCDNDQVCGVSRADGSLVGCVDKSTCGDPPPMNSDFVCNTNTDAPNCCCKPARKPCIRERQVCIELKKLNITDVPKCNGGNGGSPGSGSPSGGGGPTGGGDSGSTSGATTFAPPIGTMIFMASVGAFLRS